MQELSSACERAGLQKAHDSSGSAEELASLLVSIPDRAASSSLKGLQPSAFTRQVSVLTRLVVLLPGVMLKFSL